MLVPERKIIGDLKDFRIAIDSIGCFIYFISFFF